MIKYSVPIKIPTIYLYFANMENVWAKLLRIESKLSAVGVSCDTHSLNKNKSAKTLCLYMYF